ncbi:MAG: hypothetical protein DMF63_14025 [Acidobacteria bacterium]|nr:MAG: hypothetical protein DMF63_14025 [Acidobacteriota bacterium]
MAESVITIEKCDACGAEVRDESVFCYNCGGRVRGDRSVTVPEAKVESAPEARPPLRSAASLRNQRRSVIRQPVEITWERPQKFPLGFVITTIVLVTGALVLFLIALYLH